MKPCINRGLEFLWLLTVVLVPLSFLRGGTILDSPSVFFLEVPKVAVLRTTVGIMAVLWLFEWGLEGKLSYGQVKAGLGKVRRAQGSWWRSLGWIVSQPTRWVTLAVCLYLAAILMSTLLSPSFSVSLWGEIPGQDGYAAYTLIIYFILFAVIATHLRTMGQLWRLLGASVAMGVLFAGYGVLQHYGYDIFEVALPNPTRVQSLTGNPIFAASTLLLTTAVTVVAATVSVSVLAHRVSEWVKTALWAGLLAIQLLGIIFTLSRGPWVGLIGSLTAFLLLTVIFVSWRKAARGALVLALAAFLTSLVLFALPSPSFEDRDISVVSGRFTSIGRDVAVSGLGGRVEMWRVSLQLMREHPWYEFDAQGA